MEEVLFIAEKPQVARDIADALGGEQTKGNGFIRVGNNTITWCFGHLLTTKQPEAYDPSLKQWKLETLPLNLFPLELEPIAGKEDHTNIVLNLINQADVIVNVGDPDDEGQLLVDELLIYAGNKKPVKRLLINDNNINAVKKALNNLKDNDEFKPIYFKALARQAGDLNYGLTMTRACTINAKSKGYNKVLSLGRVQTPILGLITRRYLAFKNHVESFYYTISGEFTNQADILFNADLNIPEGLEVDEKGRLINIDQANQLVSELKDKSGVIENHAKTEKEASPPLPFNLLNLQRAMNQKYKYTASKTLEITQELREKFKAITYNRSDCSYLSEEQYKEAPEVLENLKKIIDCPFDTSIKSKAFNDKKITAHTAIIPTLNVPDLTQLNSEQKNIYMAIVMQYVIQFLPNKKYFEIKGNVNCDNKIFRYSATKTIDSGYLKYFKNNDIEDEENVENSSSVFEMLDKLKNGDDYLIKDLNLSKNKTKPQPLFTENTLLSALVRIADYVTDPKIKQLLKDKDKDNPNEHGGIGTPATRSAIIETLKDRNYITLDKDKLIPTETGLAVFQSLPEDTTLPNLTALWTEQMNEIQEGRLQVEDFIKGLDSDLRVLLTKIDIQGLKADTNAQSQKIDVPCVCGGELSAFPKVVTCNRCEFKLWRQIAGITLSEGDLKDLLEKGETKRIKGFTKKDKTEFSAKLVLDDKATGKVSYKFHDSLETPCACGGILTLYSKYAKCDRCDFQVWRSICGKELTENQIKTLIAKGKTGEISGFISKASKPFSASLELDRATGRVKFIFGK